MMIGAEINAEVDNAMRHFTRRKIEEQEQPKPQVEPEPVAGSPATEAQPAPQAQGPVI